MVAFRAELRAAGCTPKAITDRLRRRNEASTRRSSASTSASFRAVPGLVTARQHAPNQGSVCARP